MKKVFIITAVIVGIFLALQVRSFQKVEFLLQRSGPESVFEELRVFQIANQQLRTQLEESEKNFEDIQSKITSQAVEAELLRLQLIAGEHEVSGQGIEIIFNISVPAYRIADLITQLVTAGAEAIAINDIRLTPQTAGLRDVGGGLLMRRHFLRAPFRISVIGPKQELKLSISQSGGFLDRLQNSYSGLRITLSEREKIVISKLPE
ncbi:DUF881 domain-containing protein [Candidatus Peregrinibacteria bacterium]|nr:DUF881 domain-containing protein [Candidatus Peregrinibacteria bacterium]